MAGRKRKSAEAKRESGTYRASRAPDVGSVMPKSPLVVSDRTAVQALDAAVEAADWLSETDEPSVKSLRDALVMAEAAKNEGDVRGFAAAMQQARPMLAGLGLSAEGRVKLGVGSGPSEEGEATVLEMIQGGNGG